MRVSLVYIGIIVGMVAVVLAITLFAMRVARWRRDRAMRRHPAPMLVMPLATADLAVAPRPALPREEWIPRNAPGTGLHGTDFAQLCRGGTHHASRKPGASRQRA